MSSFGKKSLAWWKYEVYPENSEPKWNGHSNWQLAKFDKSWRKRWFSTPKDMQILILEKWYPIGAIFTSAPEFKQWGVYTSESKYVIEYYVETTVGWMVKIKNINVDNSIYTDRPRSPLTIIPTEQTKISILRDFKLKKLLDI